MSCDCRSTAQLFDGEARTYADEHLERLGVRADGVSVLYRCPETGSRWIEDYPPTGGADHVGRVRLLKVIGSGGEAEEYN